ncbi:hypothetical protein BJ999_002657 [Actinomadura citrea]|jgi:hypothetical protein|uniref:Uncharacterized protein n=1 Tax=Actinomadura citrea TaxID=46158 RepID=A0A7Y9G9J4_9ACTN|nr:hypothetical protein [Actinomadura citrea]
MRELRREAVLKPEYPRARVPAGSKPPLNLDRAGISHAL